MKPLAVVLLFVSGLSAQTGRTVNLNWIGSPSPGVTGTNVFRATGTCAAAAAFTKLNVSPVPVPTTTYSDTSMPAYGDYCYYVTAIAGSFESEASNKTGVQIVPKPPSGLTAVSPATATVKTGSTVQFVANAPVSQWTLIPQIGTISQNGLYRAPSQITGNNLHVTVQASDGDASALADVTIRKK